MATKTGRSAAQQAADARYRAKKKADAKTDPSKRERAFWLFEFYPESAPQNWHEILADTMLDILVSPLHDQDLNEDGTKKKPHYHGIVFFDAAVSFEKVRELLAPLNGPIPICPVGTKRNCAKYLCHLNNPEKHQYNENDVVEIGSADYWEIKSSDDEKYSCIGDMMDWCDEQGQYSYATLLRYARANEPSWFKCLCNNGTYVMKEYCKSAAFESRQKRQRR